MFFIENRQKMFFFIKKNLKITLVQMFLLFFVKNFLFADTLELAHQIEENIIKEVTTNFSNDKINDDAGTKKKLKNDITPDQFIEIMQEISTLRLENNFYKKKLEEIDKKLKEKIKEIEDVRFSYENKLKIALTGIGERASNVLLEDIHTKGILKDKLLFKVQIGIFNNYEDANDLKNKLRSLGHKTWIVCMYKGFVVPLETVLDSIKKHKEYGGEEE